jgi:hypothetical protein
MKRCAELTFISLVLFSPLYADNIIIQKNMPAETKLSYEELPISSKEKMGIVGFNYNLYPFSSLPYLYTGLSIYSAAVGKEGGFFTLGYNAGVNYPLLGNTNLNAGFFLGGGGGSSATFPGSGLMLRSHISVEQHYKNITLGVGIARTDFPDTLNAAYAKDYHAFVSVSVKNDIWQSVKRSDYSNIMPFNGNFYTLRITPSFMYYKIDDKPVKRAEIYSGAAAYQPNMSLLGIQVEKFLTNGLYLGVEAYGAGKNAAGYAAIHSSLGYKLALFKYLNWENKLIVGFAGDGNIDTGGGLILQPMTGISIPFTKSLSLKTMVGRIYAPQGKFSSTTLDVGLSWQAIKPNATTGIFSFSDKKYEFFPWRISTGVKTYFVKNSIPQSLLGFELSMPINNYFDLNGNTYWAFAGNIGSYAEGMFGIKAHTKPLTSYKITPMINTEIGVAGGGHITIDGYLLQTTAGFSISSGLGFDVAVSGGRVQSSGSAFKADVAELKLTWNQISVFR